MNNLYYWILSISLTVIDSLLLAKFINKLKGDGTVNCGLIAASFFLLSPAKLELTIWTFFSYKLVHLALFLISLILFEEFLQNRRKKAVVLSFFCLFISLMFYEASLLVPLVFLTRIFLFKTSLKNTDKIFVATLIVVSYMFYAVVYYVVAFYMHNSFKMSLPNIKPEYYIGLTGKFEIAFFDIIGELAKTVILFFKNGVLLTNAGFSLSFENITEWPHLFTIPIYPSVAIFLFIFWSLFLLTIIRRPLPLINILYITAILFLGSLPFLVGRTFVYGPTPEILHRISYYHYFTTIISSMFIGILAGSVFGRKHQGDNKKVLFLLLFLLASILGYASYNSIKSYVKLNESVTSSISHIGDILNKNPKTKIDLDGFNIPCPPEHAMRCNDHKYHVLSLLYGENVVLKK
jgi:hypothetical protein